MSAALRAVDTGTTGELLAGPVPAPGPVLDLRGLLLPPAAVMAGARFEAEFVARLGRAPHSRDAATAVPQLRAGAADAFAGWLKYGHSLPTPQAWLAVLGWTLWYLHRASAALGGSAAGSTSGVAGVGRR